MGVPARLAGVVAVGAVDSALVRAPFSAGGRALDLVAPGVGILQQTLDGAGGYADRSFSGTSMATPHVAGVAALALAAGRATTAPGLARLLTRTALDLGPAGRDAAYGAGLVRRTRRWARALPAGTLRAWRAERPPTPQIARAQWLLGLDAPESAEEIRRAWKERVARTHPDRNAERASAATRVTAAFNQARELCEWWLEAGEPWPKPMPPEALRARRARARRAPARRGRPSRTARRSAPGDLVVRTLPGREPRR